MSTSPFPLEERARSLPEEHYRIKVGFLRFCARFTDFFLALSIVLATPSNESINFINSNRVIQASLFVLIHLLAPTIEAATASRFSTTPGKWLFGLRIQESSGGPPSFRKAFRRYWIVFTVGEGLMLLPLSFLAGIYHLRTFSRTNTTFWDKRFATEIIWYGPKWKRLFVTIGVLIVLDRLAVYWPL